MLLTCQHTLDLLLLVVGCDRAMQKSSDVPMAPQPKSCFAPSKRTSLHPRTTTQQQKPRLPPHSEPQKPIADECAKPRVVGEAFILSDREVKYLNSVYDRMGGVRSSSLVKLLSNLQLAHLLPIPSSLLPSCAERGTAAPSGGDEVAAQDPILPRDEVICIVNQMKHEHLRRCEGGDTKLAYEACVDNRDIATTVVTPAAIRQQCDQFGLQLDLSTLNGIARHDGVVDIGEFGALFAPSPLTDDDTANWTSAEGQKVSLPRPASASLFDTQRGKLESGKVSGPSSPPHAGVRWTSSALQMEFPNQRRLAVVGAPRRTRLRERFASPGDAFVRRALQRAKEAASKIPRSYERRVGKAMLNNYNSDSNAAQRRPPVDSLSKGAPGKKSSSPSAEPHGQKTDPLTISSRHSTPGAALRPLTERLSVSTPASPDDWYSEDSSNPTSASRPLASSPGAGSPSASVNPTKSGEAKSKGVPAPAAVANAVTTRVFPRHSIPPSVSLLLLRNHLAQLEGGKAGVDV